MLENEAKGSYGSYSKIGRPLAERIHFLLTKEQIFSEKSPHKKHINDYFKNESPLKNKENDIDIFSENINTKNSKISKDKSLSIDASNPHDTIPTTENNNFFREKQRYIFHFYRHNEIEKKKDKLKFRKSIDYNPKTNIIYKKVNSGPKWATLTGRDNNNNIKIIDYKFYFTNSKFLAKHEPGFNMRKQTQRGPLTIYYDSRIRTDEHFSSKKKNYNSFNNNKPKSKFNFRNKKLLKKLKKLNLSESNKNFSGPKNKDILDIKKNNQKNKLKNDLSLKKNEYTIIPDNKTNKKRKNINLNKKLNKDNHSINFAKYVSREKLYKIATSKKNIQRSFFNPRYSLIKPRTCSMVFYDKESKSNIPQKKFKGVESHLFYDPNKIINKINNHSESNALNFGIMCGRINDSDLPFHMLNSNNRVSLDTMTEKSLRMNSYSNEGCENAIINPYNKKFYKTLLNDFFVYKDDLKSKFKTLNKVNEKNKYLTQVNYRKKDKDSPCVVNNQLDDINLRTTTSNSINTIKRNRLLDFYF